MALMTPGAAGAHGADAVRASLTRRDRDTAGLLLATLQWQACPGTHKLQIEQPLLWVRASRSNTALGVVV